MNRLARATVVMCVTITACSPPTAMAGLSGSYAMTMGADTLHLDSAGHYSRVFVQFGTPNVVAIDTGRWRVSNKGRLVALAEFPARWPQHGRFDSATGQWHEPDTTIRTTVALTIETTWNGRVVLGVRPEVGWRYRRLP